MFSQKQSLTEPSVSPLVSVCIPTRNGSHFIEEALNSVIAQEYKNIEVIVSDDESTDNTLEIVNEFKIKVDFPVYIYSHKPAGIGANWNNCLKKANGEFIKFLFQDDVLFPPCIKEMIQVFHQDLDIGLVASKRKILVDDPDEDQLEWISQYADLQKGEGLFSNGTLILDKKFLKRRDLLKHPTNKIGEPSAVLFKRSILEETGYFKEYLNQDLDYEFYFRALKKFKIAVIKKELVGFRLHSSQATKVNKELFINDKDRFDKILFREFFRLLHKEQQRRLLIKFFPNQKKIIKFFW